MGTSITLIRAPGAMMAAFSKDEEAAQNAVFESSAPTLNLEKRWQEVHVGLTGSDDSDESLHSRALWGVRQTELAGYSMPPDVRSMASALRAVKEEEFHERVEDYYGGDESELGKRFHEAVLKDFHDLQAFYEAAAAAGEGVVIMIW